MPRAQASKQSATAARTSKKAAGRPSKKSEAEKLAAQIATIEASGGDGEVELAGGGSLELSSLDKEYFRPEHITKGELMRFYLSLWPLIGPLLADRPLSLKRFPEGASGPFFFQQKPPSKAPAVVRVEEVHDENGAVVPRLVAGDLPTLLYTVQIGALELHPWHSRVGRLDSPDLCVIDLDPGAGASFERVREVALWVKEVLDERGLRAGVKTSGATGMHVVLPLPRGSSYEASASLALSIASAVAEAHPRVTTLERALSARPKGSVYLDHLQNAPGKTLAMAYTLRVRKGAPVSTPLSWDELEDELSPGDFTLRSLPERLGRVGDLWAEAMAQGNTAAAVREARSGEAG